MLCVPEYRHFSWLADASAPDLPRKAHEERGQARGCFRHLDAGSLCGGAPRGMINSMDTRSRSPQTPRRPHRRGSFFRLKFLLRTLGLLLVAAIVVGIGTTANQGWGPNFRGGAPQFSAQEAASRNMLDLARTASDLASEAGSTSAASAHESASPSAGSSDAVSPAVDPKSAQELDRASQLLDRHVELLTPGLAAQVAQENDAAKASSSSTPTGNSDSPGRPTVNSTSGSDSLAKVAMDLGVSANTLLDAASTSGIGETAALLGAGIEQRLEAQRLAALVPDHAKKKVLPALNLPDADHAWQEALASPLPTGSCTVDGSPSPTASPDVAVSSTAGTETATSVEQRAATSIGNAADAAFRQAYGYQMAVVKHPGSSTSNGWKLSSTTTELGHRLEDLLPEGCAPVRAAAYALPSAFDAEPLTSVAASEAQLAGLLRDATSQAASTLRPALITETWLAAERSFTLTRTIPDLTKTS